MFKKKFAIFFLFLTQLVFSQTKIYSLVFKDEETNQVIEDVNVFILKSKQNFLSNAEGKVIISVLGSSNVQFTHSSYKAQTVRSLTLKIDEENIVYLKPITSNLDEIILTKQHPQKILKSLVENSIKNLSVPSRLKVYCREFFKLNNTYSYYNDGLMNFQISGKPNSFKTNILVEQNRSYGLIDEEVSQDLLGTTSII